MSASHSSSGTGGAGAGGPAGLLPVLGAAFAPAAAVKDQDLVVDDVRYFSIDPRTGSYIKAHVAADRLGRPMMRVSPTDPTHGKWSRFLFPADGTQVFDIAKGEYITPQGRLKANGKTGYPRVVLPDGTSQLVHVLVALLYGVPNRSGNPASTLLVVDHIDNRSENYCADNLQLLTHAQNAAKGNRSDVDEGNEAYLSCPATLFHPDPASDPSWVPYDVYTVNGKELRSFTRTDSVNKIFHDIAFPRDGSAVYRIIKRGGAFAAELVSSSNKYPNIHIQLKINGRSVGRVLFFHRAVALLWGVRNASGIPMSDLLLVDHIDNNIKNYHVDNLRFVTLRQNTARTRKGEGDAEDDA